MQLDKVAVITGASRGIGAETAKLFARNGYSVCINYLTNSVAANQVAAEIKNSGGNCAVIQADISREQEVIKLFNSVDQELGKLDVLVNNAAILKQQCSVTQLDADRINEILRVNVTGCILCCREAVKRMSISNNGHGGSIVNVSSGAAKTGSPNEYVDYAASKGAIDTFTIGLSTEVAAEGIRVNGVRPGFIYTEMHAAGGEPDRVNRLKSKIPMQRGGQPSEIAEAIYWLASTKASYVTGSILDLAGGM